RTPQKVFRDRPPVPASEHVLALRVLISGVCVVRLFTLCRSFPGDLIVIEPSQCYEMKNKKFTNNDFKRLPHFTRSCEWKSCQIS
ncbi:unnamed protein product, partial [Callosobruchus maculatus]